MAGPSDIARRAFAAMKDGGGSDEGGAPPEKPGADPGAAAGRKLKAAIDSGDGTQIYDAFKAMVEECGPTDQADDMTEGEE